jgi:hypothetical protein
MVEKRGYQISDIRRLGWCNREDAIGDRRSAIRKLNTEVTEAEHRVRREERKRDSSHQKRAMVKRASLRSE